MKKIPLLRTRKLKTIKDKEIKRIKEKVEKIKREINSKQEEIEKLIIEKIELRIQINKHELTLKILK